MWNRRDYLIGVDLSCKVVGASKSSTVVQDYNTTVQKIVERSSNGVINPESLRNAGFTYADLGLPTNMSVFDRIDLMRANAAHISHLSYELNNTPPSEPPSPPSEPPAPSA